MILKTPHGNKQRAGTPWNVSGSSASLAQNSMYKTERNNVWRCPNKRRLLYQAARLSNEQKGKRANHISGNRRKINRGETSTLLTYIQI